MKTTSLSVIVFIGLMIPSLAAPNAGAVREVLRLPTIPTILISQNSLPNDGQVSEVFAASSYTYLHVVKDGKETWLAIPRREIPVGTKVRYGQGAAMKSFHSKTLNRTFDEVFFLGGVEIVGDPSVPGVSGHPSVPGVSGNPSVPGLSGHPPIPNRQPSHVDQPNSGQISEVIAAGTYTYLHVMNEGKGIWLAIPRREISVGTKVRYGKGAAMKSFHSKTLNRTFDEVFFLSGVAVAGE